MRRKQRSQSLPQCDVNDARHCPVRRSTGTFLFVNDMEQPNGRPLPFRYCRHQLVLHFHARARGGARVELGVAASTQPELSCRQVPRRCVPFCGEEASTARLLPTPWRLRVSPAVWPGVCAPSVSSSYRLPWLCTASPSLSV
jgi:hypothetical protein